MKISLTKKSFQLCEDCQRRLETNPLRIFDCKVETCQKAIADAPKVLDFIDEDCQNHFGKVKEYLEAAGLTYILNPRMVRGLDYYTRTAFEIIHDALAAKDTVIGGGRYDGLVEELGGPPTPPAPAGAQ